MRIVYLHQYFNTPEMPGGTRSYEMARRLVAWGHEVHMVTSWREPTDTPGWLTTEEAGIQVHWLPVPYSNHMSYGKRLRAFLKFALGAARKAASLPADILFATSTPLTIALPGVYAARRQKVPMVFEVRDLWPEVAIAVGALRNPMTCWAARRLERFAYRNSARVIALSPGMAEGVARAGYSEERIATIPNSSDLDLFRPDEALAREFRVSYPELGDGPIILYPGTLGRINGVAYFAELAAQVVTKRPDCRFVIIGSGIEWDRVRARGEKLGVLGANLFMYPALPKRELVEALAAASVVASLVVNIPEMEANSANKFFDGLASGTPVAINYCGWQADVLKEAGAGFVLPRDVGEAANHLVAWLNDPAGLQEAGRRARTVAEEQFSRDKLAEQLHAVLLDAVASPARTPLRRTSPK